MDKWIAVPLTAAAGALVAMQAPINSGLGKSVGTFAAATVSFTIGTILLLTICVTVGGGLGDVGHIRDLNWYYLTGGALGAAYVTTVLVTVRELGAIAIGAILAGRGRQSIGIAMIISAIAIFAVRAALYFG